MHKCKTPHLQSDDIWPRKLGAIANIVRCVEHAKLGIGTTRPICWVEEEELVAPWVREFGGDVSEDLAAFLAWSLASLAAQGETQVLEGD